MFAVFATAMFIVLLAMLLLTGIAYAKNLSDSESKEPLKETPKPTKYSNHEDDGCVWIKLPTSKLRDLFMPTPPPPKRRDQPREVPPKGPPQEEPSDVEEVNEVYYAEPRRKRDT